MSAVAVNRKWRVWIDDVEYTYASINFEKTHPSDYPDTFTVVLNGRYNIAAFAHIELRRDGIVKFEGYVEKREWTSDVDTIVSGRCRKVLTWKKWTERFEEARGVMQGFFGVVYPEEVFKFIIRCPISDVPSEDEEWRDYPHQKIGWGINFERWTCSANVSSNGTDPVYTKLRLLDFYWRNRGTDSALVTLSVNAQSGNPANPWSPSAACGGAGICVNDCNDDTDYIYETTNGDVSRDYGFQNLPAAATGINDVTLYLKLRKQAGWWGLPVTVMVEVSPDGGTSWILAGYVTFSSGWLIPTYNYAKLNVKHILDTVTRVNNAEVKITKYSGPAAEVRCSCIYFRVDYSADGSQEIGDWFEVNLGETRNRVCAIVCQSRYSSDAFPRHYCIQRYSAGSGDEDFNDYIEVDVGADRINVASATHIDHTQLRNEDTYTYSDKGVGQLSNFEHTFGFQIVTNPIPTDDGFSDFGPVFTPWAVTNEVDDLWAIRGSTQQYLALYVHRRTSAPTGPCIALEAYNGGAVATDYSIACAAVTWYWVRITKADRVITAYIYPSQADLIADTNLFDTLQVTIPTSNLTFRYLFAGITWNTGDALLCDGDIETFNLGDWINIVCDTDNTCARDIIHSWSPIPIERIRIYITATDTHSWEISQIYIYECDEEKYCVMEDA